MQVFVLSWNADGSSVLSVGVDAVKVWDVRSGACVDTLPVGTLVAAGSLTPDGQRVVLATGGDFTSGKGYLSVWDTRTAGRLQTWEAHTRKSHTQPISAVRLSEDGARVVSGGWDGFVRLWDLESGRALAEADAGSVVSVVEAVAPYRGGRFVFVGNADKVVQWWDTNTGHTTLAVDSCDTITGLAVAGERFLLASGRGDVRVHELDWEWARA
jgi:WD40 repeat protein